MATYKLIQDIEAEDKILGPLTLKQFIFALVTAFFGYIDFLCINAHVDFMLVVFLPPTLIAGFFAVPFGKDQPTEVWALAKIRFYFKPRKRIWDQSGMKEMVTITVPKKIERVLTNGLSQTEVRSRLKTLASTIDSRGWATKNVNVNLATQPDVLRDTSSDRLVSANNIPQQVPDYEIHASDDMLDATNNPIAQQFDTMINDSAKTRRQQLIDQMNSLAPAVPRPATGSTQKPAVPNDYWFLHQSAPPTTPLPPDQSMFDGSQIVQPGTHDPGVPAKSESPDEAALVAQFKAHNSSQSISYAHMRTIQPLGSTPPPPPQAQAKPKTQSGASTMPAPASDQNHNPVQNNDTAISSNPQPIPPSVPHYDPAILSLANNNDLNVATLAREANKALSRDESSPDEVVISLH